ncbi:MULTISPECIES: hypothetical protein [unclassified Clostridium]|uniref:hypothetical protein n=1 Tax=unclassified Clostridium TaxID=2614128 RepID=UPI0025B8E54D|nr:MULTISPECIES: hypothetical protein [unclassified Clostridium]
MNDVELVFFYESSHKNIYGQRKIEIKKGTYIRGKQPMIEKIRTCNTKELAEKWCLKQGWGKHGYKKNLITNEIELIN